jgi:outer membrane biosynthesis protein TonB
VRLLRSEPFSPDESPLPKYPEDAKAAGVEGDVAFHLEVGSGCAAEEIKIDEGPKMLREAVENTVKDWKFCQVPEGQEIQAAIAFRLNCPAP